MWLQNATNKTRGPHCTWLEWRLQRARSRQDLATRRSNLYRRQSPRGRLAPLQKQYWWEAQINLETCAMSTREPVLWLQYHTIPTFQRHMPYPDQWQECPDQWREKPEGPLTISEWHWCSIGDPVAWWVHLISTPSCFRCLCHQAALLHGTPMEPAVISPTVEATVNSLMSCGTADVERRKLSL